MIGAAPIGKAIAAVGPCLLFVALAASITLGSATRADAAEPAASPRKSCPIVLETAQPEQSLLERASDALAEERFAESIALYEALEQEAASSSDASRLAFIRASLLRARIEAAETSAPIERAAALLHDLDALDDPPLAARIRLHVAQSLIEATLADPALQPRAEPLVTAALESAEHAPVAATDAVFAAAVAGNQAEWLGLVEHAAVPALAKAQQATLLAQRAGDEAGTARWLALTGRIEAERGRTDEAIAAYRAAAVRLEAARGGLPATNLASLRAAQRRSDATYEALVDLLLERASASEDDAEQQALLRETRRVLEARKAAELRDYFRDACLDAHRKAEPDDIPGTLVLYPVLLEDRMELIASRDGRFWQFTVPIGSAELAELTQRYRAHLENLTTRRHLRESIALHELVIAPVLPLIDDAATKSLVFVAEGSLRTIPIGALRESVRGRYLIERIPVSVTPSLTLTSPGSVEPDRVRVLRAGISESIDGFAALPAVATELDALGARYKGDALLDEDFDSTTLARALERRPYGIVHIASHGEFLPDSSESYLLAWQDRITMDELASLLGATQFRGQGVQLLTLSACQTAAGDERAALGLAGLAVKAGARSALATLWSISDEAAAQLIDRFYEELAKPDVSRAEALRRAQLEISQRPEWAHPGYWGAFMLIGDWT